MILQHPFQTVTPSLDGEVLHALARARETFTVTWLEMLLPDRRRVFVGSWKGWCGRALWTKSASAGRWATG